MESRGAQPASGGVDLSVDDVRREHVCAIRIGVAEEVGKSYSWKRVIVGIMRVVKFYHFGSGKDIWERGVGGGESVDQFDVLE